MSKPLEEHMADFLIDQKKLGLDAYCRRCLEFWKTEYGEDTARRVEALIHKQFHKGANDGKR